MRVGRLKSGGARPFHHLIAKFGLCPRHIAALVLSILSPSSRSRSSRALPADPILVPLPANPIPGFADVHLVCADIHAEGDARDETEPKEDLNGTQL